MGTPHHHHCQMLVGNSPQAESFSALLEVPPHDSMELLLPSASVPWVEPYQHSLVKDEVIPETDCSNPNLSQLQQSDALRGEAVAAGASRKRKEADQKGKGSEEKKKKKKKSDCSKDGQVLPYVHVRARRGQATDSHSLAERARREKINARMKLLQELVPGCNKISGTALVLDEIINHVQSLQQQVEVLSMKLAAFNSWIDFDVDSLIYSGLGAVMDGNFGNMSMPATEFQLDGNSEMHHQQWPLDSIHQPILPKEESQSIYTPSEMHHQQWSLDSIHQPILPKEESQSIYTPEASPYTAPRE